MSVIADDRGDAQRPLCFLPRERAAAPVRAAPLPCATLAVTGIRHAAPFARDPENVPQSLHPWSRQARVRQVSNSVSARQGCAHHQKVACTEQTANTLILLIFCEERRKFSENASK